MHYAHNSPDCHAHKAGTEVNAANLARWWAANFGYQSHFLAVRPGSGLFRERIEELSASPVGVLGTSKLKKLIGFFRAIMFCKRVRPDAVVIHFFNLDTVLFAAAARLGGAKAIVAVAGSAVPDWKVTAGKYRLAIRGTTLLRTTVVAASDWILKSLMDLGALFQGSGVIHNGCDVHSIARSAAISRARRSLPRTFTIGMVARLDPVKDYSTLLEAFASLRAMRPGVSAELRVVGEGPLLAPLRDLAARLHVDNDVVFMGARSDVSNILGELDLFVLSTNCGEGFGIVLIEALAAGVPVIASDVPACREVLREGELGTLFPAGNVEFYLRSWPNGWIYGRTDYLFRFRRNRKSRRAMGLVSWLPATCPYLRAYGIECQQILSRSCGRSH